MRLSRARQQAGRGNSHARKHFLGPRWRCPATFTSVPPPSCIGSKQQSLKSSPSRDLHLQIAPNQLDRTRTKQKRGETSRQTHKPTRSWVVKAEHSPRAGLLMKGRGTPRCKHHLPVHHHQNQVQKSGSDLLQPPSPESSRKHYILALLFHLPLVQPALASCQINIPIPWKPDEVSFGGVDPCSWPRLPGSLQSQWQPPPLSHPWGPEV